MFHDGVSQKAIEVRVCIRRQLLRGTHDDKPVPRIPWVIGGMHVRVWIFRKTAALIEALSAHGELLLRRIYFKNQGRLLIGAQNPLTVMPVPHGWRNAEMFNVECVSDIPIQNFTHKFSIVANDVKVVGILLQNL